MKSFLWIHGYIEIGLKITYDDNSDKNDFLIRYEIMSLDERTVRKRRLHQQYI